MQVLPVVCLRIYALAFFIEDLLRQGKRHVFMCLICGCLCMGRVSKSILPERFPNEQKVSGEHMFLCVYHPRKRKIELLRKAVFVNFCTMATGFPLKNFLDAFW